MHYLQITRLYIIYGPFGKRISSTPGTMQIVAGEFAESH